MSETQTLSIATTGHFGAAQTGLTIAEATIAAAWNIQGDPSQCAFLEQARRLFGVALPTQPNTTTRSDALTAIWIGPVSWLLVAGRTSPLSDFTTKRDTLNSQGGALFDLTASRVAWTLVGPQAATVLAKGCPLDLHPRAFAPGRCAQSVYGHINVLVEKRDDEPTFALMVARSFARDLGHALAEVSAQYGYKVLPAQPYP